MDHLRRSLLIVAFLALGAPGAAAQQDTITVASTTSTEQSGLFKWLLPRFTQASGIAVKVVALGTGQALDTGRRGDADVVLVHDTAAEERFVAEGFGLKRYPLMYNDFVVVGPKADPAGIGGRPLTEALRRVAEAKAPFVSRGDRSGTHTAELRYWREAGLDLATLRGDWYKEVGQGMGPALNTASAADAYVLTDRGTWLSFMNRGNLTVLVEGDVRLFNQYGVMLVSPHKHPHVRVAAGQAFIDWLVSRPGQVAIAEFRIDGQQLFFPNAGPPNAL